jgi:hypothetical protein
VIHRADGKSQRVPVVLRIDTPIEVDYYAHGGILPYVLRSAAGGSCGRSSCCRAALPSECLGAAAGSAG